MGKISFKKRIGWMLIAAGFVCMFLPALSGFTGFFHATYAVYLPEMIPEIKARYPIFSSYTLIGVALAVAGFALVNPKKEMFLSKRRADNSCESL